MSDNNKKPAANVMTVITLLLAIFTITLISGCTKIETPPKTVSEYVPALEKQKNNELYTSGYESVSEISFCRFGYQFMTTSLRNPNYGISISTIQVMEKINGYSVPMKCVEK